LDTQGRRFPVRSDNPKVYLPVGNCLMGHIDGRQAMALAFLNSAGVEQMIGYTVATWYGYAGWGCLDYFVEQPGRFTLAEAAWANRQALLHRLETNFPGLAAVELDAGRRPRQPITVSPQAKAAGLTPQDALGLLYDRDVLAFYGDPKWEARMAPGPLRWEQSLSVKDGVYRFEVIPKQGERSFQPVSTNGSQRGGRPIFCLLPNRIKNAEIVEGKELEPLVAADFVLVPLPKRVEAGQSLRVVFRAARAGR
jgi:zinc protease